MLSWMPAGQREGARSPRSPAAGSSYRPGIHMRLLRFLPVALLVSAVLVAAGCGGGGGQPDVPSNAVAVVGDTPITKSEFNFLIEGAKHQAKAAKATFPKPGTADYKTLQDK